MPTVLQTYLTTISFSPALKARKTDAAASEAPGPQSLPPSAARAPASASSPRAPPGAPPREHARHQHHVPQARPVHAAEDGGPSSSPTE